MQGAKITLPNGRRFALVPRSGSYSIIWLAISEHNRTPDIEGWHPINSTTDNIGSPLLDNEPTENLCCLVRNPIDRFKSSCARVGVTPKEAFDLINQDIHFWTLEYMGLLQEGITYFKFPTEIDTCSEWLGLETPVIKMNQEPVHPILTQQEENIVRQIYQNDIILWESL